MRLIDADATLDLLKSLGSRDYRRSKGTIAEAEKMLMHEEYTPTIDAEPVRHGHWGDATLLKSNFMFRNGLHATQRQCTSCHRYSAQLYDYPMVVPDVYRYRFCPHCGAKMDEEATW